MPTFFSLDKNTSHADRSNVLFVEGNDDAYFLDSILTNIGANPENIGIVPIGGKDKLEATLSPFYLSEYYIAKKIQKYGIFLDADDSPTTAVQNAHKALRALVNLSGLTTMPDHAILTNDTPSAGLYIFPNSAQTGDLERVCLDTVENEDCSNLTTQFFTTVTSAKGPLDLEWKRKSQIYLAIKPGKISRGAGYGFSVGNFNDNHSSLEPLKTYLKKFN